MISEQTFPHREAVDQAAAAQRERDKAAIASYLEEAAEGLGTRYSDYEAEDILRLLGR